MRSLCLALFLCLPVPVLAEPLMILPVKLLDTSNEAVDQSADHARRQQAFADRLASELSGTVVSSAEVADACPRETAACLLELLAAKSAERGLFIVVQKTSMLILQVFADLVEVDSQKLISHRELSFRGDNDEGWNRAADFLAGQLRDAD
ncbi:DUF2380 domain-containing protein [Paracoccus sp. MBLB3053]|uniref:DUF2380 domain-containing protein n=1 Tax=Paracoccus aurantius TaxID=3073814 RepID=A0ABU2HTM9_9RHOB|nr:DUF2380 domain-containing protein [Paracoccus sp. MBLB3053]MDS9468406.1 DUF2380 domain-containing protein [Paracoccus sp. MBLB3053]